MKLLSKREVDTAKQKDRDREIQQGVTLARRVDSLRETRAEEERSLEEFRNKTIATIHDEIQAESQKLDTLRTEVAELESRKLKAMEPLTEQREEIERVKKELAQERIDTHDFATRLTHRSIELSEREKAVEENERAAKANRESAEQLSLDAKRDREDAASDRKDAQSIKEDALEHERKAAEELTAREQAVAHKEDENARWEERNRAREEEIVKEWSLVKDRQAMWERLIKKAEQDHVTQHSSSSGI